MSSSSVHNYIVIQGKKGNRFYFWGAWISLLAYIFFKWLIYPTMLFGGDMLAIAGFVALGGLSIGAIVWFFVFIIVLVFVSYGVLSRQSFLGIFGWIILMIIILVIDVIPWLGGLLNSVYFVP